MSLGCVRTLTVYELLCVFLGCFRSAMFFSHSSISLGQVFGDGTLLSPPLHLPLFFPPLPSSYLLHATAGWAAWHPREDPPRPHGHTPDSPNPGLTGISPAVLCHCSSWLPPLDTAGDSRPHPRAASPCGSVRCACSLPYPCAYNHQEALVSSSLGWNLCTSSQSSLTLGSPAPR